jgi:hypothetical protein
MDRRQQLSLLNLLARTNCKKATIPLSPAVVTQAKGLIKPPVPSAFRVKYLTLLGNAASVVATM